MAAMLTLDLSREQLAELDKVHWIHPGTSPQKHLQNGPPVIVSSGHGVWLRDVNGKEYLDNYASMGAVLAGYGRKEIADAIYEQAMAVAYSSNYWGYSTPISIKLAAKLASMTPGDLNHVYFTCGGAESNETAFKIVRYYFAVQGKPEKHKIISRTKAYHGLTIGTLSANGIPSYRENFGPLSPGFIQIEPFSTDALEQTIRKEGPETVAAFIAEPVLGVGGHVAPPADYFPKVREICNRYGVMYISDEVITGFGRTGTMFGCQQWNVQPDVISVAKGITSGYQPLGAAIFSDKIFDVLVNVPGGPVLSHGYTYSGHATCCAAAMKNIEILEREDLPGKCRDMGKYLLGELEKLTSHPLVGAVRGVGLMAAVDVVKDKEKKTTWGGVATPIITKTAFDRNVLLRGAGDTLTIRPPLVINKAEVDQMVAAVAAGLDVAKKALC